MLKLSVNTLSIVTEVNFFAGLISQENKSIEINKMRRIRINYFFSKVNKTIYAL